VGKRVILSIEVGPLSRGRSFLSSSATQCVVSLPEARHQEFHELHILNRVTRLRYEGLLPEGIHGPLRNPIVRAYYLWMRDEKDNSSWHRAIQYEDGESRLKLVEADATWDIDIAASLKK